ncbi:hypothetical protein HPP92_003604 [Vanilla planifolia]|uniref:BHLH domain-containing protein n=1 Tax=Vanilla planifolia TaxID=51239 RepID=A0A835SFX7_VANPL|nr:hypothetical protein HPP92_003604 [Vanilla planifolia]
MGDALSEIFEEAHLRTSDLAGAASPENLFSILETLVDATEDLIPFSPFEDQATRPPPQASISRRPETDEEEEDDDEGEDEVSHTRKKMKLSSTASAHEDGREGPQKMSHITVERNRRKQMNDHLAVLRSLMPCFYVKRGDQASIIGGVVDYIKELQQLLQSLEAKKQRKAYVDVLSPRPASSPRPPPFPASPRPSPLCSPRVGLPISPRTPQPGSPYKPGRTPQAYVPSPSQESSPSVETPADVAANSRTQVADVEVKFCGANVLLKTVSHRIPGQVLKIIAVLEGLELEILHVSISTVDDTMLFSFTIKIGIECELSAEELAQEVQQTFS